MYHLLTPIKNLPGEAEKLNVNNVLLLSVALAYACEEFCSCQTAGSRCRLR